MEINNIEIKQKEFAFDGCHRVYLLDNKKQKEQAKQHGYEIKPIDSLIETFNNSCSLKFINTWDLQPIVDQFEEIQVS